MSNQHAHEGSLCPDRRPSVGGGRGTHLVRQVHISSGPDRQGGERGGASAPPLRYGERMIEVFADASRDGEAAAVGGETLAVDALANALGPVFRAPPSPTRVAVAMSGGVDSAVALLRALPDAVGVTLRLWLDPQGPDAERACCSPESVIAARE